MPTEIILKIIVENMDNEDQCYISRYIRTRFKSRLLSWNIERK